jgi:hypothetical protein
VRLAGEKASHCENDNDDNETQGNPIHALKYLDLLLLARPDFRGAFGLCVTQREMVIFVAVGGSQDLYRYAFSWGEGCYTRRAAYVLVRRLYDLGRWRNPHVRMDYVVGSSAPSASFSIYFPIPKGTRDAGESSDTGTAAIPWTKRSAADERPRQARKRAWVTDYVPVFGSATFGTRTHVFVHRPSPGLSNHYDHVGILVPKILKSQLCPTNVCLNEVATLEHIHSLQHFPGVISLVCHECVDDIIADGRVQSYIGLDPLGSPFMSIETPQEMLMVIYDILESESKRYTNRLFLN